MAVAPNTAPEMDMALRAPGMDMAPRMLSSPIMVPRMLLPPNMVLRMLGSPSRAGEGSQLGKICSVCQVIYFLLAIHPDLENFDNLAVFDKCPGVI